MYQDYKNIELVKPAGLDLKDRLVGVQRVTKVTKGGRAFGFSAIVVVGDENGVIGGSLKKFPKQLLKQLKTKKNLIRIPILNGSFMNKKVISGFLSQHQKELLSQVVLFELY